jgi:hypothetical protein
MFCCFTKSLKIFDGFFLLVAMEFLSLSVPLWVVVLVVLIALLLVWQFFRFTLRILLFFFLFFAILMILDFLGVFGWIQQNFISPFL